MLSALAISMASMAQEPVTRNNSIACGQQNFLRPIPFTVCMPVFLFLPALCQID